MPKGKTGSKDCPLCGKSISLFAYNRHVKGCGGLEKRRVDFTCRFCGKEFKRCCTVSVHERSCVENPARVRHHNQHSKAKASGKTFFVSEETRRKLSEAAKSQVWTEERRKTMSRIARARGLGGHTSKRKMYFKKKNGDVVFLQSSYEIKFAEILEKLGLEWSRPDPLKWVDEHGIDHRYYPDFKIGEIYVDTKNDYLAVKDRQKIASVIVQNSIRLEIFTLGMITEECITALFV